MRRRSLLITIVLLVGLLTSACQPLVAPAPESAAPGLQAEVFVTGVPHSSANGIYCGPDGNLYIASVGGHEILVMEPETGAFVAHNSQGYVFEVLTDGTVRTVSPGGLSGPSGIAILNQKGVETIYSAQVMALNLFDAKTGAPGPFSMSMPSQQRPMARTCC